MKPIVTKFYIRYFPSDRIDDYGWDTYQEAYEEACCVLRTGKITHGCYYTSPNYHEESVHGFKIEEIFELDYTAEGL